MTTLLRNKETKARKPHCCDFCGLRIQIGEKYLRSTQTQDGEIYDWKTHKHCEKLAIELNMYDWYFHFGEGVTGDMFREAIHEEYLNIFRKKIGNKYIRLVPEILQQLTHVPMDKKKWFVIRELKKDQQ